MSLDQPKSADALPSRDLMPKDLSPEAIQRRISEQLRKTDAAAEKNQPSIDSNHLREAVGNPEPPIFMWVKTGQIVGRPFFGGGKNGWEVEYGGREGRIEQVRDEIMDSAASVANIEHIFHPSDWRKDKIDRIRRTSWTDFHRRGRHASRGRREGRESR